MPRLPDHHVARPRLHRRLTQAVESTPVTQIIAPAVSGKSTLVSAWHSSGTSPAIAYVALERVDNDPARFWGRVVSTLSWVHPGWRTSVGNFRLRPSAPLETLETLISALAELGDRYPTVLVLDRVDLMVRPVVREMVGTLLLELPAGLRAILLSRSECHLRQGLLRARDQLTELHADELAFQRPELDAYLASIGGLDIDPDDAAVLLERTEGWVGGVGLAAMALAHHNDVHAYVRNLSGSNRHIGDLLAEEVFEPQPADVQDFLLATSVLDTLDEALCDQVTGGWGSARRLEELARAGMFLDEVDPVRHRYRYRRLFAEFLRHRLHVLDPGREQELHRAAARAYEHRGDIGSAVGHFVACGDSDDAVRLLVTHGPPMAASGQVETLRSWLATWPDDFLTDDVSQMLAIARLCVMAGLRDEAVRWLTRARWRIEATDQIGLLADHALLTGFANAVVGNLEGAVGEGERVLTLAEQGAVEDHGLVAKAHHLLAGAHAGLDEFEAARRHRDAAPAETEAEVPVDAYSAWLCYREGHLEQAVEHASQLLAGSNLPWQWGVPLVARGAVRRERNQLDTAEIDLARALQLADHWSRPRVAVFGLIELALLRFAQGRTAEAHEALADASPQAHSPALRQRVGVAHAALWLQEGDYERCRLVRRELATGRFTQPLDIRIALVSDDIDTARQLLGTYQDGPASVQDQISGALLRARLLQHDGDEDGANEALRRALELGRTEGFVQVFVEDLASLDGLARRLAASTDDPFLYGLLAALAARRRGVPRLPALVEPLSPREEIALRYLPTRLSNREIADELSMSVNTLKTHLKAVYRKLGVASRADAVVVARHLHLL